MTAEQIQFIMTGKTVADVEWIGFTSLNKIFSDRYEIALDYTNQLVRSQSKDPDESAVVQYWDFGDVNCIYFKPGKGL